MHKMMDLRDALMEELEKMADRPLNDQTLPIIDKVAHAIKSIDTIMAMQESREGSSGRRYRDGYSGEGMSGRRYRDGNSGEYSGEYSGEGASGRRYYYTQREGGGSSGRRRRDSMGRYADSGYSGDGYSGRYSRDEAKDKLIGEMEGMMGDVSPETKHAIQKAIHALDQE